MNELETLKRGLNLSISKKESDRSSSVAYSGERYYLSGSVASDTNSLNISSEQSSLVLSTLNRDYAVNKIVTLTESTVSEPSPLVLKILIDHSIRTGIEMGYQILNLEGTSIFKSDNVKNLLPFYNPEKIVLSKTLKAEVESNFDVMKLNDPLELKNFAVMGIERNFPLYDGASGYGSVVLTKSGKIYFGGQYSSPDKRLGLHSEVNTILSALMDNNRDITHIGIVSSKYLDTPCDMCGICRQFISEISQKLDISPVLYGFSKDTTEYREYNIESYLPSAWTSKKWKQ